MSRRRRQANDFTDSLNSFRTTSGSEINSDTFYSVSQDSLEEHKGTNNDTIHSTNHSTILSGNSAKHFLIQDTSISSVGTHSGPDLNKRINLSQTEQLGNETNNDKENNNPQCSLKNKQLKTAVTSAKSIKTPVLSARSGYNVINQNSKRDTNYNIHKKFAVVSSRNNVIESVLESQPSNPLNCTNPDANDKHEHVDTGENTFESILCSLDNEFNVQKEKSKSQILKRLSNNFVHSPKNFTEKLLTIIEESVINNDSGGCNTSGLNLSRLTTEFKKMCKFIGDETAPEWAPSPPPLDLCIDILSTTPVCNTSNSVQTSKDDTPKNISTPVTPMSGIEIMRKRFFNKISKNTSSGNIDSMVNISANESNGSFEHLEAQCRKLFPEEQEHIKSLRRSLSAPSLISMSQIKHRCDEQLASLNISTDNDKNRETNVSPNLFKKCLHQSPNSNVKKTKLKCSNLRQELYKKSQTAQYNNESYSKIKSKRINEKSDIHKVQSDRFANSYVTVDPDELEKTLLQDIAEKRKRCLDTARLISEINADAEIIEAQKSLHMSPLFNDDNESNLTITNDEAKFLKTLMSCKNYQTYLEKQKSLFKLLENSNPSTPETTLKVVESPDVLCKHRNSNKENSSVKKSGTKGFVATKHSESRTPYKSSLSKKDNEKNENKEVRKTKFFITPGKTPPNKNHTRKKIFFPPLNSPANNTARRHILKSPHAEGLYRLNYNTIISPVGMYIRGTDMPLIQNVQAKTDNLLLTPTERNVKRTPSKSLKHSTPPKGPTETSGKFSIKTNITPKVVVTSHDDKQQEITANRPGYDSTPKNHFVLPKVSYKLPLQVKTIKEGKSPKPGTRVQKLLECAQSKVVIRHEARANSIQKRGNTPHDGMYEIHYEPEDESIHIEQEANKTNFIRRRKNA